MALLQIIQPDNPLLRCAAQRVSDFGKDFQTLVDDMFETLMDAQGVGLAGPQVAQSLRVVLVRLRDDEESQLEFGADAGRLYVVANPSITRRSDAVVGGVEGCLSLPGFRGEVERHDVVEITGQDRHGIPVRYEVSGWLARAFQHEIDHLDGILYIDIATSVWRLEEDEAIAGEVSGGP